MDHCACASRTLSGQRSDRRPCACRDYRFACESRRAADLGTDDRFRSEPTVSGGSGRPRETTVLVAEAGEIGSLPLDDECRRVVDGTNRGAARRPALLTSGSGRLLAVDRCQQRRPDRDFSSPAKGGVWSIGSATLMLVLKGSNVVVSVALLGSGSDRISVALGWNPSVSCLTGGGWAARTSRLAWFPIAATSRACDFPAHGFPTFFTGAFSALRSGKVQTAEGELEIAIPQVREAAETFASRLFPRTPKLLRIEPLGALVVGAQTGLTRSRGCAMTRGNRRSCPGSWDWRIKRGSCGETWRLGTRRVGSSSCLAARGGSRRCWIASRRAGVVERAGGWGAVQDR